MKKLQCKLCKEYFEDKDMSEEHYPAHGVGNDDIVAVDLVKMFDSIMGNDSDFTKHFHEGRKQGKSLKELSDSYFDKYLAKDLYPHGRTARTLCRKCNTFLGKYDEAYIKFYTADGEPKKVKGFQKATRLEIIKSIYAKFLSVPETSDEDFDFIEFIKDKNSTEYRGKWKIYFVARDLPIGDLDTGKLDFDDLGVVYELSDDKFIYNLMNFEKEDDFKMNNIFDIMKKNYTLVYSSESQQSFHGLIEISKMGKRMLLEDEE